MDDEYWTGSSFTVTSGFYVYPEVYQSSWTYTYAFTPELDTGREYKVTPTINDRVPNTQTDIEYVTFLFDTDDPEGSLTYPSSYINTAPSTIYGTAVDKPDAPKNRAGVDLVQLKIQDLTLLPLTTYWNGTVWQGSTQYFDIVSTTFSYTVPAPATTWTDGHSYRVTANIIDGASNSYETSLMNFIFDIFQNIQTFF